MRSLQVAILGFGALAAAAVLLASLWENPPAGRSPRQRRVGIFHRLFAAVCGSGVCQWLREALLLLLNDSVSVITRPLYSLHCRDLLPMWVVNIPYRVFPRSWMRAAAGAHLRRWRTKNGGQQ